MILKTHYLQDLNYSYRLLSLIKKHYLGDLFDTDTYEKFDQVYNNMSAMLAGEEPVWENVENGIPSGMKHKLLSFKEAFPGLKELVKNG